MNLQVVDKREILGVEVTTFGELEKPLFLAKDVSNWICHNKPSEMISNVDEDEKLKAIITHSGQKREMWFLTEDGLYEVLMQSRKPIAKEFKKKVKTLLKDLRINKKPMGAMDQLRLQYQVLEEHDRKLIEIKTDFEYFRDNAPLFNAECDELIKSVRKVATRTLGGYKTNAYKDKSIRTKVYTDIQHQIKRNFGVESYKAIKRCQLHKALQLVEEYKVPMVLDEEIELLNNQMALA